jgi:hypothetical protein
MASINRHAIEISSNTRTQCSETLPSSSLRGNPSNLGLPLPRVKSLRCDPRRDPPRRTFHPQVRTGFASSTIGRSAVPISWARGRTLRGSQHPVKPERPFPAWPRPHRRNSASVASGGARRQLPRAARPRSVSPLAQGAGRRAQGAGRRAMRPRRAAPCRRAVLPEPLKAISRPDPASPAPVHARGETAPHRPLPLREWTQSSGRLGPRQLRAPPEARGDRGARALSSVPAQCRAARELPASRVSRVGPAVRAPSPPAPSPVASTARDPSRIPYCCVHLLLRPPALRRRGSDRTLLALSPAMRGTPSTPRNCRRLPYFPTLSAFAAVRGEES